MEIMTEKRGESIYHSARFQKCGQEYKAISAAIIGTGVPSYGKTQIIKIGKRNECVYFDTHSHHKAGISMLMGAITEFMGWVG